MPQNVAPERIRKCGTPEAHQRLLLDPAYQRRRMAIEQHLSRFLLFGLAGRAGVVEIPVVVHVLYSEPAGNISDDQVNSQIDVLNRDYRKRNVDAAQVPPVWTSLVADTRIQFVLATSDPTGNLTNGIVRVPTATQSFGTDDTVKSSASGGADPWPSNKYLNIWVCNLGGGLLGYAHFPGAPPEVDGVVILNTAFGIIGTATAPFNLGRTTTHEVGHWLNLIHIWGDRIDCKGTDDVDDTPAALAPNYGKPAFPHVSCNNGPNGDMFMNYMDYVDDEVMVMFTGGQVARMAAALDGPRVGIGKTVA